MIQKERLKYERVIQDIQIHGLNNNRAMQRLGNDVNIQRIGGQYDI